MEDSPTFGDTFREEFEKHFPTTFRYLDRLSGDPDLADIVQEAFIRLSDAWLYRRIRAHGSSWWGRNLLGMPIRNRGGGTGCLPEKMGSVS